MLVFAKLLLVDEGAQVPAREPHLEAVVAHVVEGGGGEDLPEAAALELLRHDGGEEVQHRVGLSGRQKKISTFEGVQWPKFDFQRLRELTSTYRLLQLRDVLGVRARLLLVRGLVKCVPALAYHFCLNLPATFSQPRTSH